MGALRRADEPMPAVESTPACVCGVIGGLLRLALGLAAVVAVVAGTAELVLRVAGAQQGRAAELSNVVSDGWTGFRLRPGVSGEEPFVTNDLGMHAARPYGLTPPPGRCASPCWGLRSSTE